MRLRIEYFDQNESFAPFLPREGRVVAELSSTGGATDWYLLKLDEPFEYQTTRGALPGSPWRLVRVSHFLIRSRWQDHRVGGVAPTSVFILIVDEESVPGTSTISVEDYEHVAWGMCHVEPDGA
jgi:hypothetical protein